MKGAIIHPSLLTTPPCRFLRTAKALQAANFVGKSTPDVSSSPSPYAPKINVACESYGCGRRELLSLATASFLLPCANVADAHPESTLQYGASEYYLLCEEIKKVISKGKAAGILRLAFHDAGTFEMDDNKGGMNGSLIYELDRPENTGLKKSLKILEKAKSEVDAILQDMIAVAGAEAIAICGGPPIPVQLGRLDSMSPDPEGRLPEESLDAPRLKQCFKRKGFSTQELVALSGAHTLGSKGFGSPTAFDNSYYKILLEKPWVSSGGMTSMIGLPSDRALVEDDDCTSWIAVYADDQNLFFQDFGKAYVKLVNKGAKWKDSFHFYNAGAVCLRDLKSSHI